MMMTALLCKGVHQLPFIAALVCTTRHLMTPLCAAVPCLESRPCLRRSSASMEWAKSLASGFFVRVVLL